MRIACVPVARSHPASSIVKTVSPSSFTRGVRPPASFSVRTSNTGTPDISRTCLLGSENPSREDILKRMLPK
jgi:hypothetical protein